jgi:hypothetical protein
MAEEGSEEGLGRCSTVSAAGSAMLLNDGAWFCGSAMMWIVH